MRAEFKYVINICSLKHVKAYSKKAVGVMGSY